MTTVRARPPLRVPQVRYRGASGSERLGNPGGRRAPHSGVVGVPLVRYREVANAAGGMVANGGERARADGDEADARQVWSAPPNVRVHEGRFRSRGRFGCGRGDELRRAPAPAQRAVRVRRARGRTGPADVVVRHAGVAHRSSRGSVHFPIFNAKVALVARPGDAAGTADPRCVRAQAARCSCGSRARRTRPACSRAAAPRDARWRSASRPRAPRG